MSKFKVTVTKTYVKVIEAESADEAEEIVRNLDDSELEVTEVEDEFHYDIDVEDL